MIRNLCPRCAFRSRPAGRTYCRMCMAEVACAVYHKIIGPTRTRPPHTPPPPPRTRGFAQAVVVFVGGRDVTDT